MNAAKLKEQFDSCESASQQMTWLINAGYNQFGVKMTLDNDETYVVFGENSEGDDITSNLFESVGSSIGVATLLSAMGLDADFC